MGKDENLRLDRQICFLLYGASRAVTQLYQPLLAPLGLDGVLRTVVSEHRPTGSEVPA